MPDELMRCHWATRSELEREYHDREWGVPVHDERRLFKMLCLEGMQAGLSWRTVLAKMDAFCAAFDDFDPEKVTAYDEEKVEALMQNEGIIRNRLKINSVITNARTYKELCKEFGSLDSYLWAYVGGTPIQNAWETQEEIPASIPLSDAVSKDLKKRGFKFVGSTIIYAYMQSIGMVNDHLVSCAFYKR
ncbi:MAG: DNA-3-methyladenine glycosylase I [Oscillospiraceae bacterium]